MRPSRFAFAFVLLGGCAHKPAAPVAHEPPPPEAAIAPIERPPKQSPPPKTDEQDLAAIEAEVETSRPLDQPAACATAQPTRSKSVTKDLIWPVDGVVIGAYGHRDGAPHEGIDIAAPEGTAIWASAAGEVVFAGEQAGYGRIVIVRHSPELVTVYAHNAKNCVEEGRQVTQGEVIALVGQTGGATSPSVHFEVRVGQTAVNPYKHLPE
jgi:murein DD-endopeptidase MepM/ murein hydrolase activator NlpD